MMAHVETSGEEFDRLKARAKELARTYHRRYAVVHSSLGMHVTAATKAPLSSTLMFLTTDEDEGRTS